VGLKGSRVQAVVSELGGECIDIVPWHPDPEVFARRALAPARVSKVISDSERQVITAIVDEDQLSLAIGRNGQNVRLASQLIGWQIDLYGSREWLERGADAALFGRRPEEESLETSDFPISELSLPEDALAALKSAGYSTFLEIIDLEDEDFRGIEGFPPEAVETVVGIIDELTVLDEPAEADVTPTFDGEEASTSDEDTAAVALAEAAEGSTDRKDQGDVEEPRGG
jgi:N utilization substance protein A